MTDTARPAASPTDTVLSPSLADEYASWRLAVVSALETGMALDDLMRQSFYAGALAAVSSMVAADDLADRLVALGREVLDFGTAG